LYNKTNFEFESFIISFFFFQILVSNTQFKKRFNNFKKMKNKVKEL